MRSPNFEKTITLQIDTSNAGIGAVLSQLDGGGNYRPIAYVEKECLAVQAFSIYLIGKPFILQTDH